MATSQLNLLPKFLERVTRTRSPGASALASSVHSLSQTDAVRPTIPSSEMGWGEAEVMLYPAWFCTTHSALRNTSFPHRCIRPSPSSAPALHLHDGGRGWGTSNSFIYVQPRDNGIGEKKEAVEAFAEGFLCVCFSQICMHMCA